MAVNLAPIGNDAPYVDSNGNPFSGALLYTYTAGSSTPQPTFTAADGLTQNDNPMTLNAGGYPTTSSTQTQIWLTAGITYKFELKNSGGTTIWTRDNIDGINDTSVTIDQWVTGPAPTFISTTSFSLVGDQTSTFNVGRRVKTTNSGGTIYSTIKTSAFGAATTVTVVNDSGVLDSGLSAVSYGLLSATNPSTPLLTDAYPVMSGSSDKTKKLRFEVDGFTTDTTRVMTPPDQDSGVGLYLDTPQATTSGTSKDFTAPSWAKKATVMVSGLSTNGTSIPQVQIGPVAGVETTGYVGTASQEDGGPTYANLSAGFLFSQAHAATNIYNGFMTLTLMNSSTNVWACLGQFGLSDTAVLTAVSGVKPMAGALSVLRLTTVNGTDAFDAGSVNVLWE